MSKTSDQIARLGGDTMREGLADRLVDALDPIPAAREIVARRVVEFAEELGNDETLGDVVIAAENPPTVSGTELAARAGVTYRQINYWTSEGFLAPVESENTGSGHSRAYPPATIVKARVMGSLVRHFAMSPRAASQLSDRIVSEGRATIGPFTITRDGRIG